jgi:hypothetical protein
MSHSADSEQSQSIQDEIAELEQRLENAKARLKQQQVNQRVLSTPPEVPRGGGRKHFPLEHIAR